MYIKQNSVILKWSSYYLIIEQIYLGYKPTAKITGYPDTFYKTGSLEEYKIF